MHCTQVSHRLGTTGALAGAMIALVAHLLAPSAVAQDVMTARPETPAAQAPDTGTPHTLARWLDARAVTVAGRYDYIADARDRTEQNRIQTQVQIRGRMKLDAAGDYSVHA